MTRARGNWSEVWDSGGERGRGAALSDDADRRQKAKASNHVAEDEGEGDEDMFSRAGVAAE